MNNIIEYLELLGIPDHAAQLYCKLLEVGPQHVRELAALFKINRTTAYLYVDLLIEKGLVSKVVRGSKVFISPNDPTKSLEELVNKKIDSAKVMQENLPAMVTDITQKYSLITDDNFNEDEISYFKGKVGVKKIYEEALSTGELCTYVRLEDVSIFPDIDFFDQSLKKNKELTIREIIYSVSPSREKDLKFLSQNKNYSYKIMPKDMKLSLEDILIYNNKVTIINYKKEITTMLLQNSVYYNNSKEIFNFIWKMIS